MKPKTVGRVESGNIPQLRAEIIHVGLVAGTILLTSDGEIPVEYLSAGDRIITRNAGLVTLKAVATTQIRSAAVAIAAGSLGQRRPETNVILPAAHQVLIRDWRARALAGAAQAVLPAGCLIDGEFITDLGVRTMTLIQLGFDAPHVIYADGLELSVPAMVTVRELAA
ncbi:Hint domain-containing protein [Pseudosulfitobacter koreensis]|uniref:Hint domain-containing protein n=1 Tax=Pseudosulfitobacter koreensis TaxID=2968472 RepID=A0ABT1YXS9_9RHOB|nr:Hint domain-containing protein [Pseudosulfitobacter koreense]MCR8825686.1 Hint domain-containing protein [Pseudosulfitobacter koreense]